jgi:hypothetical protein
MASLEDFEALANNENLEGLSYYGHYKGRYGHRGYAIRCEGFFEYGQFILSLFEGGLTEIAYAEPHIDNLGRSTVISWDEDLFEVKEEEEE